MLLITVVYNMDSYLGFILLAFSWVAQIILEYN